MKTQKQRLVLITNDTDFFALKHHFLLNLNKPIHYPLYYDIDKKYGSLEHDGSKNLISFDEFAKEFDLRDPEVILKHRSYEEMMADPESIEPEDIAQYALYAGYGHPDNIMFRDLVELIVAAEHAQIEKRVAPLYSKIKTKNPFWYEVANTGI